jgi:hypothetical protein
MSHHHSRSLWLSLLSATATLAIGGCGLFIHSTPISKLPEQDREVIHQDGGKPWSVRLTKPAKVSGFDLAPGSVVESEGRDFHIQTAEPMTIKGAVIPAGSWFELKKDTSIVVGDVYNWNGVVHLGGPQEYGIIHAQKGDRAFFTGSLFSDMQLTQLSIATPREIGGRTLPQGSIIDLRENGQIKETFTPGEQQQLAVEREERRKERERHEQRCKEVCAPVTDFAENARCMGNCRN